MSGSDDRRSQGVTGRTAVVLGGGGSRGSFEVGALSYLYDHHQIRPSVIAGCSIGAVIASKLATGATGPAQCAALDQIDAIIRGFSDHRGMFTEEPWFRSFVDRYPSASSALRRLRGTAVPELSNIPGLADGDVTHDLDPDQRGFVDTWMALRALGRAAREIEPGVREAFRAKSVYNLDPLRELLEDPLVFGLEGVATSGVDLRLAVVSLESGDLRYVTQNGTFVDRDNGPLPELGSVPLPAAVRASAAVPGVFPPVRLGDENYVDGGVRELLPLQVVMEHLESTQCFAVLAQAPDLPRKSDMGRATILPIVARALGDIAMDEIRRDDVAFARRMPGVTVIEPEINVHGSLEVRPELVAIAIDYGFMRAADVVGGLPAEQCELSRRITQARMAQTDGDTVAARSELDRLIAERDPHGLPTSLQPERR